MDERIPIWAPRPEAYTVKTAALATGLSEKTIQRAIRAGDLRASRPRVDGAPVNKDLIDPDELRRWARDEP